MTLGIHATIPPSLDNGTNPLMVFSVDGRDVTINLNAPTGSDFPWGNGNDGRGLAINNRPLFAWANAYTRIMTISGTNNVGIGTSTPTARLHTLGTVRFEGLTASTTTTNVLTTDSSGNVFLRPISSFGNSSGCTGANYITKSNGSTSICSQIFDNGTNVGIGTISPSNKLTVNGNIESLTSTFLSDQKYKKNITKISGALSIINGLNPVTYNWRKDEFKDISFDDKKQTGFIAQELEKVLPDLVRTNENGKSVNYIEIIPYLTQSIKELTTEINNLKSKIAQLESNKISSKAIGEQISLYPNPTSGQITINFGKIPNETLLVSIYKTDGLKVKDISLLGNNVTETINLDSLSSGMYICNINGKTINFQEKFIKK